MSVHNGALIYTYLYQILLKSIVQGSESVPILAAIHIPVLGGPIDLGGDIQLAPGFATLVTG